MILDENFLLIQVFIQRTIIQPGFEPVETTEFEGVRDDVDGEKQHRARRLRCRRNYHFEGRCQGRFCD